MVTSISALSDILGYFVGYVLLKSVGLIVSLSRMFLAAFVTILVLLMYLYVFNGINNIVLFVFIDVCKATFSGITFLGFVAVVVIFKPKIQGTAFGLCLAIAYLITLFEPEITKNNPAWFSLMFICVFSFFGALISMQMRYTKEEKKQPFEMEEFETKCFEDVSDINFSSDEDNLKGMS